MNNIKHNYTDIILAFAVFTSAMIVAVAMGLSMLIPLSIGLIAFLSVGIHRGFGFAELMKMTKKPLSDAMLVIVVIVVIGALTASWRASGTITFFVYYGIQVIRPHLFLIVALLLTSLLGYAIGTSFGLAGTVGVIFMALARSGGVNEFAAAGVLMSGIYFGERTSPVASSSYLVQTISGNKLYDQLPLMIKTIMPTFAVTVIITAVMSYMNPISHVDSGLMKEFTDTFSISWWAVIPAAIMLILPLFKVSIMKSMLISTASAAAVSILVQNMSIWNVIRTCILGYKASDGSGLARILNGGGMISMLEVVVILIISSMYSGIFKGTDMLRPVYRWLEKQAESHGRYPVTLLVALLTTALFANQTIASLMTNDLVGDLYGENHSELGIDMENSVITMVAVVPWALGSTFPLGVMGVDYRAIPLAVLTYLGPIMYLFTKRIWFKKS